MSLQPGAEGSLSESVHFPPTSGFHEHQGYPMAMAPPSRAPRGAPYVHDDGRGGGGAHFMHSGGLDYDYGLRRHSCGEHLGLHSGALLEHLLLQENQKALRMASLVQSQASGCLSGCLSCGLSEKRLRFKDSEDRMIEDQRCYSRNGGEGPSRSVNLGPEADGGEYPEGWFRQPRPRQSSGERSQSRISFSEDELGRSLCQGRRVSYPAAHPTISHSQASHHVPDQPFHAVGAMESSVPNYGFSDADVRGRQRWPTQRTSYSENGIEEDGRHRASRSRVGPASTREQDRMSLPGTATGLLPRNLIGSPRRPTADSVFPAQSARTTSQSLHVLPEHSLEPSYQDNVQQQAGTQRVVTQGPVSLTNWYIIKVQVVEVGRALETKVAVGGWLVQNREHVKTSPIVNRLDIHKVVTEDGVEVSLEGTIDQETSTANGFAPGIVQCLSAGFPYMWKQLLRVRPVGESSNLAVSESLGGLHPKASKCISEDESQGNIDPKNFKAIPEGMPCSLRDCEGNSPAATVNAEPSAIQGPSNTTVDVIDAEAVVNVRAGTSALVEATVSARVETSDLDQAMACAMAGTSGAVETEMVTMDAVAPPADVCETGCLGTVTATSDAIDTDAVVIASAQVSDGTRAQCSPQDLRAQDASLASLDPVRETETPAPATEAPAAEETALVTEAPLTTDSLSKEAENGLCVDTALVTIRRGRKNKKRSSHPPVRSSRRLQQRHSSSSEFALSAMDSLVLAQTEQVMNLIAGKSGEEETAGVQAGCEEVTKTNSVIEEVLKDLHQVATEVIGQCGFPGLDSVDLATDPQPMEVEEFCQVQDHCENLSKDTDGVEDPTVKENDTTLDEFEGVEIEETILEALPSVASEEIEESILVALPSVAGEEVEETIREAPPNVASEEIEESIPVALPSVATEEAEETVLEPPSELGNEEIEESAPVTPPELLQSKLQSRIESLDKPSSDGMPQGSEEHILPEFNARMTRSLKRRLKLTPTTETAGDVAPATRTLKRLRRHSAPTAPTPDTTPNVEPTTNQGEGRSVEPDSNPETPHQEEADAFFVRIRGKSNKAVSCSNCKQPCAPQDLLHYNSNIVSSEVTPEERVLKMEQVDYPPLAAETSGATEQPTREPTETSAMKRRSGRLKRMKPANRFVTTVTTRKLLGDEPGKERRSSGEDLRKGSGERKPLGGSSRKGSGKRKSLGGSSRKGSRSLGENSRKGSSERRSLGEDSGTGSSEKRSLGENSRPLASSSMRGNSRRTSLIPPPLPPPRVEDKSKVTEAFGLKTSRSGRVLVPPLAYWRSQSIEYDKDGGIIAIFDGFQAKPADTGYFNFTPPQEKQAKKIQEKLCKAAATTVKKRK